MNHPLFFRTLSEKENEAARELRSEFELAIAAYKAQGKQIKQLPSFESARPVKNPCGHGREIIQR